MDRSEPRQAHPEGVTAACYGRGGTVLVTAGADNAIRIFNGLNDEDAVSIEQHSEPVVGLCVKGDILVSASEDNTVAIYNIKKEPAFEGLATRFALPVRHVVFNVTGSSLATAGDESDIKVVSMLDKSAKVLRGHEGAIRSLTYDPEGDLLASASTDGTLRIWKLADSSCAKELQILPERAEELIKIDWHPNGKFIAVPVGNTVAVYERDTWELAFSFAGEEGHSQPVTMAAWSPNGEYLASVSVSGEIIVWETQNKRTLGRLKHKDQLPISSVAWHPTGNEILWADTNGKVCVWKEPVPDEGDFAKPTGGDAVAAVEESAAKLDTLFDDDDDEDVGVTKRRKRIKQKKRVAAQMNDSDDDDDDDAAMAGVTNAGGSAAKNSPGGSAKKKSGGSRKRRATAPDDDDDDESAFEGDFAPMREVMLQNPFQPSSTPLDESRRILVWNNVGVITSRLEELTSSVDVEFHNVQKHKPIRMIDHYGFTLGALGSRSVAMGGPSRSPTADDERDNPSILFCRNIDHWASDETWQVFYPEGEEVEAIAVGSGAQGVIAAATSKRYLHLYSTTGVAKHIITLDGPIVSLACKDELLMAAYHFGVGVGGDQSMNCALFNVHERKVLHKDRLPLQAGALLNWIGFTDDGIPAICDSTETVSLLLHDWGYTWSPVAELQKLAKNKGDKHWITGINDDDVMCVICKGGSMHPSVLPRPMVSTIALKIPIVASEATTKIEEQFLRAKINFEHIMRVDELDETDPDDYEVINKYKLTLDKQLLTCISRAVQLQKAGRALELTMTLSLDRSVDVAIKLAVKAKLPMLAERMSLAKAHVTQRNHDRQTELLTIRNTPKPVPGIGQMRRQSFDKPTFGGPSPVTPAFASNRFGGRGRLGASKKTPAPVVENFDEEEEPEHGATAAGDSVNTADYSADEAEQDAVDEEEDGADDLPSAQPTRTKASPTPNKAPLTASKKPASNPFAKKTTNPFAKKATPAKSRSAFGTATSDSSSSSSSGGSSKTGMFLKQAAAKKTAPSPKKKKKKDPNYPKKPVSSYLMFLADTRAQIKIDMPNSSQPEKMKEGGKRWNEMDAAGKKVYSDKAAEAKKEWKKKCDAYDAAQAAGSSSSTAVAAETEALTAQPAGIAA